MRKVLMSGAAFLTSSVTLTGEEIESLAPDESLKDMEKQLSLLERYLNELPDKLLGLGVRTVLALILFVIGSRLIAMIRHFFRRAMERSSASEEAAQFLDSSIKFCFVYDSGVHDSAAVWCGGSKHCDGDRFGRRNDRSGDPGKLK